MNSLKDLKMTESEIECGPKPEVKDANMVIKVARSLMEIMEMVPVFVYQEEQQKVSCDIQGCLFQKMRIHLSPSKLEKKVYHCGNFEILL